MQVGALENSRISLPPGLSKGNPFQPCPDILLHQLVLLLWGSSKGMQKGKDPHPLVYATLNAPLAQVYQVDLQAKFKKKKKTQK